MDTGDPRWLLEIDSDAVRWNPTESGHDWRETGASFWRAPSAGYCWPMPADPIDPGAMPCASVELTSAQVRTLIEAVEGHRGTIRIEKLRDAYARVVLIGDQTGTR
jgi:hypothetical protein